jgi:PIN domain nuclease of toxin-antitoxin system
MRLLLDTHVFLWYVFGDKKLPASYRTAIQDRSNDVLLSVASLWEVVIKSGLGKLPLPAPAEVLVPRECIAHGIASLPIDEAATVVLAGLPHHHRDPFDRMLVAQALQHGLTLLSVDPLVRAYAVPFLPVT